MPSHVETFMDRCQFKWLKTIFLPFVIRVCSRLIGCCSNGCGYPIRKIFSHANDCCCLFEKYVHPFERLVLPAQTLFETVWNALNIYFTSIHLMFVLTVWWISASGHFHLRGHNYHNYITKTSCTLGFEIYTVHMYMYYSNVGYLIMTKR